MTLFSDAKPMAKALRKALTERKISITHSEALELVSKQFGFSDWNTLSARIDQNADDGLLVQPRHWSVTSNTSQRFYRFGLDPQMGGAAMLASKADSADQNAGDFAAYMQTVSAEPYLGKRIRLTGDIQTRDADIGTIWMRVDHVSRNAMRFDNMMQRPMNGALHGTIGWTRRVIVLDVPDTAGTVHFGFLLQNKGTIWARKFQLEAVDDSVATTENSEVTHASVRNLDFSVQV